MLPINRPINNPGLTVGSDNPSSTEKNSSVNPYVINLESRIEQNRPLIEDLKRDRGFQNTLTLLRRESIPDRMLLNFLTGKASLQECVSNMIKIKDSDGSLGYTRSYCGRDIWWIIDMLVKTYEALEDRSRSSGPAACSSHFLPKSLTDPLTAIFSHGYWESEEKTCSKINTLMHAIESKKLDLSGADLSYIDFEDANLAEANLAGANLAGAGTIGTNFLDANLLGVNWETEKVRLAGEKIDRALYMFEYGQHEKAIHSLTIILYRTVNLHSQFGLEKHLIMDKIFEAALEISLAGYGKTALSILEIIHPYFSYGNKQNVIIFCIDRLKHGFFILDYKEKQMEDCILRNRNAKCLPYFLGKIYENDHPLTKNNINAKKYLGIAAERGFEPVAVKKQRREYQLMLEAQKSNESVFSHLPRELVNHIALLRREAILAQLEFNQGSAERNHRMKFFGVDL
ncbi:MAG: hypothetical protein K0R08_1502 [Solimicrobium sp.]|jgi:hypothetical protein|nr:hypothetical protein [Solimicrobium sp.]